MNKLWAGLALLVLLVVPARAQDEGEEERPLAGGASADFLRLGVSARASAMGEAYSALTDEASALYWNPAALTRIEKRSATFMHSASFAGNNFDYGSYGQRIGQAGFGASVHYLSAGTIAGVDEFNADTGTTFKPNDLAVTLGGAYVLKADGPLGGWAGGAAVKLIRSSVVESAQTVAADFGVLSPAFLRQRLRLAATLSNLGKGLSFGSDSEPLPLASRLGAAYKANERWTLTLDGVKARGEVPSVGAGTEYLVAKSEAWNLAGRFGFNSRALDEGPGVSGGVGVGFKALALDYGFLPFSDLGSSHRVSLTFRF